MARWENLHQVASPTTRSVIKFPETSPLLLLNTAGLERLMELGGICNVRLSSEQVSPRSEDPIAAKVRYELSETVVPVASLADWRTLNVIFNLATINEHFQAQKEQSDQAYAQLFNDLLKHAVVSAGLQVNMKEYEPIELISDISTVYFLYIVQAWILINKNSVVLSDHFQALGAALIANGVIWHLFDKQLLNNLDKGKWKDIGVRFSFLRSINIDRAAALILSSKLTRLVKTQA